MQSCMLVYRLLTTIMVTDILMGHGQIWLPLADGLVSTSLDGNLLKFAIDSGSGFTYVVYKDWYEKKYGTGSCQRLPDGCYSCPTKCNPYKKERYIETFAAGMAFEYVVWTGSLSVDGKKVQIDFGLIIGYTPRPSYPDEPPFNVMGLAYGNRYGFYPIVRQLYIKGAIDELAFSVCTPGKAESFSGKLAMGSVDSGCKIKQPIMILSLRGPSVTTKLDTEMISFGMVSIKGDSMEVKPANTLIMFDTGAYTLVFPRGIFETFLNTLTYFASRDSGGTVHVKTSGAIWFVEQKGLQYLPTVTFTIGTPQKSVTLKLTPSQYIYGCDHKWCTIMVIPAGMPYVILGRPFFTSYFTEFNLVTSRVNIAHYQNRGASPEL